MKFIFKLFGWLFSNLLLILVVVALSYAYVYWDDPFGKDTPVGKVLAAFPDETAQAKKMLAGMTGAEFEQEPSGQDGKVASADASSSGSIQPSAGKTGAAVPVDDRAGESAVAEAEVAAGVGAEETGAADSMLQAGTEPVQSQPAELTEQVGAARQESEVVQLESEIVQQEPALVRQEAALSPAAAASLTDAADVVEPESVEEAGVASEQELIAVEFPPAAEFSDEGVAPGAPPEDETVQATKALVGDVFVPAEIEDALNQLHNDGSVEDVVVMQQVDKPARQLIIDARKAFYRHDYPASIAAYKQLIANDKDNFDALGELGNVYYTQGNMELAAEAYYQAAAIMIAGGQEQRAASLIDFLVTVDAEKAKKLGEMLVSDQ